MIELSTILTLLLLHFFADFIAQDDRMATEKSSDDTWLIFHVSVYILPFFMFGWLFALVNWIAHFATDYVSSRVAK